MTFYLLSGKKKSGKRAAVAARNDKLIGCSLPDKLERHPWYLDFPRWHETRRGGCVANNGDKTFASAAQLKAATLQFDVRFSLSLIFGCHVTLFMWCFSLPISDTRPTLPTLVNA